MWARIVAWPVHPGSAGADRSGSASSCASCLRRSTLRRNRRSADGSGVCILFDPQSASQTLVLARFFNMLAVLIFLAVNATCCCSHPDGKLPDPAHQYPAALIRRVLQSGRLRLHRVCCRSAIVIALIAILLMTNLSLGILTRSAPQLNIFAIASPLPWVSACWCCTPRFPIRAPARAGDPQRLDATTVIIRTLRP